MTRLSEKRQKLLRFKKNPSMLKMIGGKAATDSLAVGRSVHRTWEGKQYERPNVAGTRRVSSVEFERPGGCSQHGTDTGSHNKLGRPARNTRPPRVPHTFGRHCAGLRSRECPRKHVAARLLRQFGEWWSLRPASALRGTDGQGQCRHIDVQRAVPKLVQGSSDGR